jgi:hypothetical protein
MSREENERRKDYKKVINREIKAEITIKGRI